VIRSTAISTIDQAILSAINFLSGLLLIRFATQEEYGLFTQLIGMQSLFSVLHAGMFVSAYLALLPRFAGAAREEYRAGMARGEAGLTLASTLLVALATWLFGKMFGHSLTLAVSFAAAVALLGLWWREFVRASCAWMLAMRCLSSVDSH
jgi:O-antigen/teichoic acid export membrane protein